MRDLVIILLLLFIVLASFKLGLLAGQEIVMTEAFQRKVAVECVGVKGYYWECEP